MIEETCVLSQPDVDESSPITSSHRLLNEKEVAKMLGCSPRTVRRQADAGTMPWGVKVGNLRRWPAKSLEDWVVAGCPKVRKLGRG